MITYEVHCEWDSEAQVWYVSESNVPGLTAEAPSRDAMRELLRQRVPELLQLNVAGHPAEGDVPLELLYQSREKLDIHY